MYFLLFFFSFILSFVLTFVARQVMLYFGIVDRPRTVERKIHRKKIPYGGGLSIFLSFFILSFLLWMTGNFQKDISGVNLFGLFLGGLVLIIGGVLDDKFNLKAKFQIIFPIVSSFIIVLFGIGPEIITNPFGGVISLNYLKIGNFFILSDFLVFFWLMGMMYTTKILDGLDGLVAGIVFIGAMVIFFLSLQSQWLQPDISLLSIIFAGVIFGFLVWNFHPAKIFLGEGGSLFAGYILGSLAIISGSKIATTLLVMGVPILDLCRVIIYRLKNKRHFYEGDAEHLHFKLLKSGLNQSQAVLLLYSISFLFGITALFLQTSQRLIALLFLFVLMLLLGVWLSKKENVKM